MNLNLGEKIRGLRKSADMTQEQLADRLGMSGQAVSRWENGTTYPDLELILPLAEIFGVTSDYLLGIPEEKKALSHRYTVCRKFCRRSESPSKRSWREAIAAG